MLISSIRVGVVMTALTFFAAGCAAAASPGPTPPAPTAASVTAPSPVAGGSSSSDSVHLTVVPSKSKAGYRVREQLANLNLPSDAVGTTSAITGTISGKPDGTLEPSESKFVVDVSTLKSDRSGRDNYLRQNVLTTDQYQYATFVPTSATGLPSALPASGQVAFKLIGDLTIRNVTKSVTWDATCQAQSSTEGTCHATTSFTFEDFNLPVPHVFAVLSIEDHIGLEVDVDLVRAGG